MVAGYLQIKNALKMFERQFGRPATIRRQISSEVNTSTGEITKSYVTQRVGKLILLRQDAQSKFIYDLAYIASGKNFTYGAFYDQQTATIVVRNALLVEPLQIDDEILIDDTLWRLKGPEKLIDCYTLGTVVNALAEGVDDEY